MLNVVHANQPPSGKGRCLDCQVYLKTPLCSTPRVDTRDTIRSQEFGSPARLNGRTGASYQPKAIPGAIRKLLGSHLGLSLPLLQQPLRRRSHAFVIQGPPTTCLLKASPLKAKPGALVRAGIQLLGPPHQPPVGPGLEILGKPWSAVCVSQNKQACSAHLQGFQKRIPRLGLRYG